MIFMTNNAGSSLVVAIAAADTEAQIQTADAAEFPVLEYPGDVFPVRIRDNAGNYEYVLATARDGNRITILRGREGTTAQDFPAGASFEIMVTAEAWERLSEGRWVRPMNAARAVLLPTRIDAATFTIPGDVTAMFPPNRALHLIQTTDAFGYVATSFYAGGATTITVQDCTVDAGLALVELGLEVESAPKYGNAANTDTLGGKTKAEIIAEALGGTAANATNAAHLAGKTEAEIITEAQAGMASDAELAAAMSSIPPGVPVGTSIAMAGETVPTGFLEENGAAVSRTTYAALFAYLGTTHGQGDGSTTFNIPDSRGEFHRGWDHGRTADPDRASRAASAAGGATGDHVGTVQGEAFKSHSHPVEAYGPVSSTGENNADSANINHSGDKNYNWAWVESTRDRAKATGGNETRPRNTYRMYCIKY